MNSNLLIALKKQRMKIASFFSGGGGLDEGFEKAGFHTLWANQYDRTIWDTFQTNFPNTVLDKRSMFFFYIIYSNLYQNIVICCIQKHDLSTK